MVKVIVVLVIVVKRVFSLAKTIVVDVIVIYIPRIPVVFFVMGGGMLPRKKIFELCNLVRFGAYFHKFFTFKKSKNFLFFYKNNYKL